MTQFKVGIGIFLLLLILSMAGANYYQYNVIQEKNEEIIKEQLENGILRQENDSWEASYDDMRADYKEAQGDMLELAEEIGELQIKGEYVKQELEDYKKRESVVLGRPTLVERMANRATKKVFKDLECATGDVNKCGGAK
jgi:predicted nuclease with TOPRIM domain